MSKPVNAVYDTIYNKFTINFDSALSSLQDLSGVDFKIERYSNDFEIYTEIDDVVSLTVDDAKLILDTKDGISSNVRISYDPSGIPISRRLLNKQSVEVEKFELPIYEPLQFTSFLLEDRYNIKLTTNIDYLHTNINNENFIIKMAGITQDISSIAFNTKEINIHSVSYTHLTLPTIYSV